MYLPCLHILGAEAANHRAGEGDLGQQGWEEGQLAAAGGHLGRQAGGGEQGQEGGRRAGAVAGRHRRTLQQVGVTLIVEAPFSASAGPRLPPPP